MNDESKHVGGPGYMATNAPGLPPAVDRATFQAELDKLRVREKAHTRQGDAIAAARRRLPMVEVNTTTELIGPTGPVTLLDAFEGRKQLIAYFHAWWPGQPAAEQCEGCTFFNSQVREFSYIHSRDVTYATLCKGPYEESVRYRDFLGLDMPWYSVEKTAAQLLEGRDWQRHHLVCYVRDGDRVFETYYTGGRGVEIMAPTHGLLDMTVYGRQETWEDSPTAGPNPGVTPSTPTPGVRTDAPSPSGRASKPDAPTTSANRASWRSLSPPRREPDESSQLSQPMRSPEYRWHPYPSRRAMPAAKRISESSSGA